MRIDVDEPMLAWVSIVSSSLTVEYLNTLSQLKLVPMSFVLFTPLVCK